MKTLEQIKDELANEYFNTPLWTLLADSQRVMLIDLIAILYAREQVRYAISRID